MKRIVRRIRNRFTTLQKVCFSVAVVLVSICMIGVLRHYTDMTRTTPPLSPYPVHRDIIATMFYIGEAAVADNGYIANADSTWDEQWLEHYGGVDDPVHRDRWLPAGFIPAQNPFYIALPYNDLDEAGRRKPSAAQVYWRSADGESLVKGRWVEVCTAAACAYGQWEDAGPFGEDDVSYVFGDARPSNARGLGAGIDVSPAIDDYLDLHGSGTVVWRFVDMPPSGPWLEIQTD